MVIYISILSVISITIVSTIVSFSQSYKTIKVLGAIDNSAINTMEKMTSEIRKSASVSSINSDFVSDPGFLTLVATSSNMTKFYVQNNIIQMDSGGSYFGPITSSDTKVTGLKFTLLKWGNSYAVKIDMTVNGTSGIISKTKTFHSTTVLRGK